MEEGMTDKQYCASLMTDVYMLREALGQAKQEGSKDTAALLQRMIDEKSDKIRLVNPAFE